MSARRRAVGSGWPAGDAVAGPPAGWAARGSAAVLGDDRRGRLERGGGDRGWGVAGGRCPVVPRGWRDAVDLSLAPAVGPVSVVRRARGDRDPACAAGAGCARSPAGLVVRRRRSRGSCGATRRRAAAGSSIGPRPRSGMPSGALGGRRSAKLAANDALRRYVQDRLAGTIAHAGRRAGARPAGALDRSPPRSPRRTGAGRASWSPEQIANRLPLDFPDDESMRISHEAIYQALYVQGRGALRRELTACLRTGRALRVPRARTRGRGKEFVTPGDHDQRAARRGRRPGRARPLGRRPHPRARQLRDRHARRAHHPVHDAAAPAAHGRARRAGRGSRTARRWPGTAPRPSATRSPPRSRRCPSSSADR